VTRVTFLRDFQQFADGASAQVAKVLHNHRPVLDASVPHPRVQFFLLTSPRWFTLRCVAGLPALPGDSRLPRTGLAVAKVTAISLSKSVGYAKCYNRPCANQSTTQFARFIVV